MEETSQANHTLNDGLISAIDSDGNDLVADTILAQMAFSLAQDSDIETLQLVASATRQEYEEENSHEGALEFTVFQCVVSEALCKRAQWDADLQREYDCMADHQDENDDWEKMWDESNRFGKVVMVATVAAVMVIVFCVFCFVITLRYTVFLPGAIKDDLDEYWKERAIGPYEPCMP